MPFPVDKRFIIETETKLGIKFPPDYARKMMQQNGGTVETSSGEWVLYPILDSSDKNVCKEPATMSPGKPHQPGSGPAFLVMPSQLPGTVPEIS